MPRTKRLASGLTGHPVIGKVLSIDKDIFVVGGFLRDLMRGIPARRIMDIDFALNSPEQVAGKISAEFGGTLVKLKKDNIRVVLRDGTALDFSALAGDIENDLRRRDFTINALAWSPKKGLIDPFSGLLDLEKGTIRHILKKNFKDDPLRLLRAYRFSSELCFSIATGTRETVRELSGLITRPACERITLEFIKLLNGKCAQRVALECLEDGILMRIISLSYSGLLENIYGFSKSEVILKRLPKVTVRAGYQGLSSEGLLRLESLLIGSGGDELCLSNSVRRRVDLVKKLIDKYIVTPEGEVLGLYDLFGASGGTVMDIIAIAGKTWLIKDAMRHQRIKKGGLLDSREIMSLTGLQEGPRLGRLIENLRRLQFERKLKSRAEALKYLKQLPRLA